MRPRAVKLWFCSYIFVVHIQVLIDWVNNELVDQRIIVKDIQEDLFDGQVLQKLLEKLGNIKLQVTLYFHLSVIIQCIMKVKLVFARELFHLLKHIRFRFIIFLAFLENLSIFILRCTFKFKSVTFLTIFSAAITTVCEGMLYLQFHNLRKTCNAKLVVLLILWRKVEICEVLASIVKQRGNVLHIGGTRK